MPDKLPVRFTSKEYVSRIQYVHLNGHKFELYDTMDTLEALEDESVQINEPLAGKLKSINVIEYSGSQRSMRGATKGVNFDEFLKALGGRRDRISAKHRANNA